eukprot:scaffold231910_cov119-Cyclotella_meneghiniana.AAC.1
MMVRWVVMAPIGVRLQQYCRVDDGGTFGGVGDQAAWLFGCFRCADVIVMANFARRSLVRKKASHSHLSTKPLTYK